VAVSPSDTAPALVVLDAKMVVVGPKGQREVPAEQFFIGPNVDITRMTVLEDGEVLTAIRLPMDWSGARFYFEKVADRNTWDFPLVNIAAAMVVTGDKIDRIRIAAGAVQCVPRRLTAVEAVVTGQPKNAETAGLAGQSAVRGATPLNFNHFKIPLLQNLVTRAIRDA
jgi:xanthine dehydrogenase YagS FAD-binding subunit